MGWGIDWGLVRELKEKQAREREEAEEKRQEAEKKAGAPVKNQAK